MPASLQALSREEAEVVEALNVREQVDEVVLNLGQAPTPFELIDGPGYPECSEGFCDSSASRKPRRCDLLRSTFLSCH